MQWDDRQDLPPGVRHDGHAQSVAPRSGTHQVTRGVTCKPYNHAPRELCFANFVSRTSRWYDLCSSGSDVIAHFHKALVFGAKSSLLFSLCRSRSLCDVPQWSLQSVLNRALDLHSAVVGWVGSACVYVKCGAVYSVLCVCMSECASFFMSVYVLCISPCVLSVRPASCPVVLVSSHRVFVQGALRSI